MTNETETTVSTRSRVFWITLSLMIAAMFFYAASSSNGGNQAFAGEAADAGASASEAMADASASMADASMM